MVTQKLLVVFLAVLVSACAGKPSFVWVQKGVSFAGYQTIELTPIQDETGGEDATGEPFEFDVPGEITKHIKSGLESKGYMVRQDTQVSEGALVIQTHLLQYEPGTALGRWMGSGIGRARCTIRSFLIDKKTGNVLGDIVVPAAVSEGGLFSIGAGSWIIGATAQDVVDEVDRLIKGRDRA